ncbi:MAG TPA: hypothetical protein IGS53_23905 [Leptolyngbyaceae cyanobacterium M33_DOE_097]|uniref:Uncharacterized protein n=1 Tax=Oscillatoriales cyanobacterium SpSt-418 TaxID=2282169 RepID=A0A7C3PLF5_9CYAN|nr:hypothetical protein [Leptolyngbyaceae cyanobacterium M33_DOE_097]
MPIAIAFNNLFLCERSPLLDRSDRFGVLAGSEVIEVLEKVRMGYSGDLGAAEPQDRGPSRL